MELVTPGIGLIFWQTVTFLVVLFLLSKFAWKPIMQALRQREESIENALSAAEKAKMEMQNLQESNKKLLAEARLEREKIIKEATEAGNHIIETAKQKATVEGGKMIEQAREAISNEKKAALTEVKNLAATLSIDIAEKILKKQLGDVSSQEALVKDYLKEITLN